MATKRRRTSVLKRYGRRNADKRRESAAARDEVASKRTVAERIQNLDQKLGAGLGAKKERAKLSKLV